MVDESEVDDDEYTHYSYDEIAWEAQDNDWQRLDCDLCGDVLYEAPEREPRFIAPYHSLPRLEAYEEDADKPLLGFELELETDGDEEVADEVAWRIDDAIGRECSESLFIYEEDGSLGPGGFEMVSRPLTLEGWQSRLGDGGTLERVFKTAVSGCSVYSHTGMHVHVDRRRFDDVDQRVCEARLVHVAWRFRDSLAVVNRRDPNGYCRPYDVDDAAEAVRYATYNSMTGSDHGVAISIGGRKTIEYRGFQSSTNPHTVLASIEFVDALVEAVKVTHHGCIEYEGLPQEGRPSIEDADDVFDYVENALTYIGKPMSPNLQMYLDLCKARYEEQKRIEKEAICA
jgi:hypothetical protein